MGFAGMNHAWMDLGPCSLWRKGKRFLTQESRTPAHCDMATCGPQDAKLWGQVIKAETSWDSWRCHSARGLPSARTYPCSG